MCLLSLTLGGLPAPIYQSLTTQYLQVAARYIFHAVEFDNFLRVVVSSIAVVASVLRVCVGVQAYGFEQLPLLMSLKRLGMWSDVEAQNLLSKVARSTSQFRALCKKLNIVRLSFALLLHIFACFRRIRASWCAACVSVVVVCVLFADSQDYQFGKSQWQFIHLQRHLRPPHMQNCRAGKWRLLFRLTSTMWNIPSAITTSIRCCVTGWCRHK